MNNFDLGHSLENFFNTILGFMPQLLAALLILLIGYFISRGVASLVRKGLRKLRFDRALHTSVAGNTISRIVESPSQFVGKVVFWLLFLGVISLAITALNLPVLNDFLGAIYNYIPHVVAAVIIFLIASFISAGAAAFVQRVMGKTPTAKLIATAIPVITMSIAAFMILNELQIATDIVNILFTAIVGALALGFALAFGLGGRDVARDLLDQAYDKGRSNAAQVKEDVQRATRNTREEARRAKDNL